MENSTRQEDSNASARARELSRKSPLRTFESEPPVCPFRKCDMRSNHKVVGKGWDVPADPNDPNNQSLNRRVEISVYPAEQP